MARARPVAVALALLFGALLCVRDAAATVALCLSVAAPAAERDGFEKLVRAEVARHPTHQMTDADCKARLRVELFEAAGTRYLTAQIDSEVPARFPIRDASELGPRLEDAIRLTLRNDPASLADDPARMDAMQRFGQAILVRGKTTFRVELFEAIARDAGGATTLPGFGVSLWRGSGTWQVGGRIHGAFSLEAAGATHAALEVLTGADACVGYEPLERAFWTPYAAACVGVQLVEFAGRIHPGATTPARAYDVGLVPGLRLGARFFRWHAFDLDLFVQGGLPISNATDVDGVLLPKGGIYVPSLQAGLAVGF